MEQHEEENVAQPDLPPPPLAINITVGKYNKYGITLRNFG
jgi:hypothetical protein